MVFTDEQKAGLINSIGRFNSRKLTLSWFEKHGIDVSAFHEQSALPFATWVQWVFYGSPSLPTCNKCRAPHTLVADRPTQQQFWKPFCSKSCGASAPETQQKRSRTNQQRYGGNSPMCSETVRQKSVERNLIVRGVAYPTQAPEVRAKVAAKMQNWHTKWIQQAFQRRGLSYAEFSDHTFLADLCSRRRSFLELMQNEFRGMYPAQIKVHFDRIGFRDYKFEKTTSLPERRLRDWLTEHLPMQVVANARGVIAPKEFDIWIPDRRIAVEVNGCYWHADDKLRHLQKLQMAEQAGVQLLQFWDFEIDDRFDLVCSMILAKCGVFAERLQARKCSIRTVSPCEAKVFFDDNHLQGHTIGGKVIGLYSTDNRLVSAISYGASRFDRKFDGVELYRFATLQNVQVVGGLSRLLSQVSGTVISYADRRFSSGNVYEQTGFRLVRATPPNYFWWSNRGRLSRYATMKSKLPKLLGDEFMPDCTEVANMEQAGYVKVWDCGHGVYTR